MWFYGLCECRVFSKAGIRNFKAVDLVMNIASSGFVGVATREGLKKRKSEVW